MTSETALELKSQWKSNFALWHRYLKKIKVFHYPFWSKLSGNLKNKTFLFAWAKGNKKKVHKTLMPFSLILNKNKIFFSFFLSTSLSPFPIKPTVNQKKNDSFQGLFIQISFRANYKLSTHGQVLARQYICQVK